MASIIALCYFIVELGHSQETLRSTRAQSGSSDDNWEQRFHPERYEERQKARLEAWYKSWENKFCSSDHVKAYWLLTLLIPEPSEMSSEYNAIVARNEKIKNSIKNGEVDFEATDLADKINIATLTRLGRTKDAQYIEGLRQSRINKRNELIERQKIVAAAQERETALKQQIYLLTQRVAQAQAAASAAQIQADESQRNARKLEIERMNRY